MDVAWLLTHAAAELAVFAGFGFFLFAVNDIAVDLIFIGRALWRAAMVYSRYPRAFARTLAPLRKSDFMALFVPCWDEAQVIGPMLAATLERFDHANYRIFVGYYRNDPATEAAIHAIVDERVEPVQAAADGPTTKADCLNHIYDALLAFEMETGISPKAIVLHDAEDLVHPLELKLFERLIDRAAVIQLPVIPLVDPASRWISGHYCDEFAEAHGKELVVREAVGAAVPLAGVGCAIERGAMARLAALNEGAPFAEGSLTEDYEIGLRLGALGLKTMFVRIPARSGDRAVVATRGHFPASLGDAVRQKARWLGGIALNGWDRLGWQGGWGERWMRLRDRRGPLAAVLLVAGYLAALLWSQLWLARALGAPVQLHAGPVLRTLLWVNAWLLLWRIAMRLAFTTSAYGLGEGLLSAPRMFVSNLIAMLAAFRAIGLYVRRAPSRWDKTRHMFPKRIGT